MLYKINVVIKNVCNILIWALSRPILRWKKPLILPNEVVASMPLQDNGDCIDAKLNEIPSETTYLERNLLYRFYSTFWNGEGDVVEVGPFMGGTTRAIALGMMDNLKYAGNHLLTYDRFTGYYDAPRLVAYLQPLFDSGVLNNTAKKKIVESTSFLEAFNLIHGREEYAQILEVYDQPLPRDVDESQRIKFALPEACACSAFFVDGCKSWYSTKVFMKEAVSHTQPGSYFIFQDYAWYTCFWIPAFITHFRQYFRLIAYVDCTYIFQLRGRLTKEDIDQSFPDKPEAWNNEYSLQLFDRCIARAHEYDDINGIVYGTMQKAAMQAYNGNTDCAKRILMELRYSTLGYRYRATIDQALQSPTYYPDGKRVILT